jgi:hypothetical protein
MCSRAMPPRKPWSVGGVRESFIVGTHSRMRRVKGGCTWAEGFARAFKLIEKGDIPSADRNAAVVLLRGCR